MIVNHAMQFENVLFPLFYDVFLLYMVYGALSLIQKNICTYTVQYNIETDQSLTYPTKYCEQYD
jgi:hypothetical protein